MQLFLLAHQDDEFFLMARLIQAVRQGEDIAVIYLTDGGKFSAVRDQESRAVLKRIGVKPERIRFLGSEIGLTDTSLYRHLNRAFSALNRELDALPTPTRVFTHAWEGGHQDHDCVYALTVLTAQVRGWTMPLYQMPCYREVLWLRKFFAPSSPLPENGPVEYADRPWRDVLRTFFLAYHYRTQRRSMTRYGSAILLRRFFHSKDPLQRISMSRLGQRPHKGLLYYQRKVGLPWETVQATIAALAAHTRQTGKPA